MNTEDQFEQRLRRQPLRGIPSAWRGEILTVAREAQTSRHPSPVTRHSLLSTINSQLSTVFWPAPQAWAGLAAIWILIFAVNFFTHDNLSSVAGKISPPSLEMRELLKQQEQLLAELVGPPEKSVIDRPKMFAPQPRSEYRNEFTVV